MLKSMLNMDAKKHLPHYELLYNQKIGGNKRWRDIKMMEHDALIIVFKE